MNTHVKKMLIIRALNSCRGLAPGKSRDMCIDKQRELINQKTASIYKKLFDILNNQTWIAKGTFSAFSINLRDEKSIIEDRVEESPIASFGALITIKYQYINVRTEQLKKVFLKLNKQLRFVNLISNVIEDSSIRWSLSNQNTFIIQGFEEVYVANEMAKTQIKDLSNLLKKQRLLFKQDKTKFTPLFKSAKAGACETILQIMISILIIAVAITFFILYFTKA